MKNVTHTLLAIMVITMAMSSCSTESVDLVQKSPDQVIERIDMVMENDIKTYIYKESVESDKTEDLVTYNFYVEQSRKIDFNININENETITIKLVNKNLPNPWSYNNTSYSIFPQADLNNKAKYITVLMDANNEGGSLYTSNFGNDFPRGVALNVFTIVEYDIAANEMLCRIQNLELVHESGDESKTVRIDGTFRGSLTF